MFSCIKDAEVGSQIRSMPAQRDVLTRIFDRVVRQSRCRAYRKTGCSLNTQTGAPFTNEIVRIQLTYSPPSNRNSTQIIMTRNWLGAMEPARVTTASSVASHDDLRAIAI